jgi:hypothetical protein
VHTGNYSLKKKEGMGWDGSRIRTERKPPIKTTCYCGEIPASYATVIRGLNNTLPCFTARRHKFSAQPPSWRTPLCCLSDILRVILGIWRQPSPHKILTARLALGSTEISIQWVQGSGSPAERDRDVKLIPHLHLVPSFHSMVFS